MAPQPPHLCARCLRKVVGICQHCERARDKRRGTDTQRGYGWHWAQVSQQWLRDHPWCGQRADGLLHIEHSRCVQQAQRTRATCTDHIISVRQGGDRYDPRNLQSLCAACNAAKSNQIEHANTL